MTHELTDLRTSILEQRYTDALAIVDELEGMHQRTVLRQIETCLVKIFVYLIKNQMERRLANSWVACFSESLRQIQKINLKNTGVAFYVPPCELTSVLEDALADAIRPASVEIFSGRYTPTQLLKLIDQAPLLSIAHQLMLLTYDRSAQTLLSKLDDLLLQLPGSEVWSGEER